MSESEVAAPAEGAAAPGRGGRFELALDITVLLLAVMSVARLAQQAAGAHFFTDECFHAHVAERIAAEHRLPVTLPGFYSGFAFSYPPLFHLVGAALIGVAGPAAFPELNVALWALLLMGLFTGLGSGVSRTARRAAVVLCVTNHWLAVHAVRLYAEMLFAGLVMVAGLLALRLRRTGRGIDAVWLGVAAGLLTLTKPAGSLTLLLLGAVALAQAVRRRRAETRLLGLATGVGALIAAPYWIRNQVEFGSAFYPLGAPDLDHELWMLTLGKYGASATRFFELVARAAGPWILGITAVALFVAVRQRRGNLAFAMLAGCVLSIGLAPLFPIHDPRHVLPLLPLMALAASATVFGALTARPSARLALEVLLVLIGAFHLARLPEYRKPLDLPANLGEAYTAIRGTVAPDVTVLSLWTYDTFYYTGRPATWPIPWGQPVRPMDLFRESDPDRFVAALDRYRIGAILLPLRPPAEHFDAANYPRSLVDCTRTLVEDGRLRLLWQSPSLALVARPSAVAAVGAGPVIPATP